MRYTIANSKIHKLYALWIRLKISNDIINKILINRYSDLDSKK